MSGVSWTRLIRFHPAVAADQPQLEPSAILYGEPIVHDDDDADIGALADAGQLTARVIDVLAGQGPLSPSARVTDRVVPVGRLIGPLGVQDVTDIKCIGLNYRKHIQEAGRSLPPYPSLFLKPVTSLADYNDIVPIPRCAQQDEADYEGELCVIIGRDCKDVAVEDALNYVAGYTAGDDVSTRKWQRLKERAGGVPQWCFSKGFDKFAPLGPCIVAASLIPDPSSLELTVAVNGEQRQSTPVADLVFDTPSLISFLSQGTTLRRGTVIMTGTPGGVGCTGAEDTWRPLKDGDKIEVFVSKIGTLRHSIRYE